MTRTMIYAALRGMALVGCVGLVLAAPIPAQAVTNFWTGTGDKTNWFNTNNWSQLHSPQAGEDVVISNAYTGVTVLLTNSTAALNSLTLTNATLLFTNWTTTLTASNVSIMASGTVTHATNSATTTNASGQWIPDARVNIICTNLIVAAGGNINANATGYKGISGTNGCGPGAGRSTGPATASGGGYGGIGGNGGGLPYDTADMPTNPGSAGGAGGGGYIGQTGGGVIMVNAANQVSVEGIISANGASVVTCGAPGSGGCINITCLILSGTNGSISATGGNGSTGNVGGGGGGRIALHVDAATQNNAPLCSVRLCAARGPLSYVTSARPGTIYLSTPSLLTGQLAGGQIVVPGMTSWAPNSLTVSNGLAVLPASWQLAVTNDLAISAGGGLELTNSSLYVGGQLSMNGASDGGLTIWTPSNVATSLWVVGNMSVINASSVTWYGSTSIVSFVTVGGNLIVTNASTFYVYSGVTNTSTFGFGAYVTVAGNVTLASNSWIYPKSTYPTNGTLVSFAVSNNLNILTNAGFNADLAGYCTGNTSIDGPGPGGGKKSSAMCWGGGGYGGAGGSGTVAGATGGTNYGSAQQPSLPGSSGGNGNGSSVQGMAGGLVWIVANGSATLNGTLSANGENGTSGSGGASGGGIYLACRTLVGTNGILLANGGTGSSSGGNSGGGGGGGRIAVWRVRDYSNTNSWSIQVNGGAGGTNTLTPGATGTVYWGQTIIPSGTIISFH